MGLDIINLILSNVNQLVLLMAAFAVLLSSALRKSLLSFIRLFLYREDPDSIGSREDDVDRLEAKIKEIENDLTKNVLKDRTKLIEREVSDYINKNLKQSIDDNFKNSEILKNTVIEHLKSDIDKKVEEYLESQNPEDLQKAIGLKKEMARKDYSHKSLIENMEREARNASMLKMVMINLFVASTVAFLLFNIVMRPEFTTDAYVAIVALYFSLGAFMLYIIRTSHFRTSVLLAIKEDERNYYNVLDYLAQKPSGSEPSEYDVDIIRMMLTNRSEREHKAQHPYEVIMKGVSGTNIQFKGGKINLGKGNESGT